MIELGTIFLLMLIAVVLAAAVLFKKNSGK